MQFNRRRFLTGALAAALPLPALAQSGAVPTPSIRRWIDDPREKFPVPYVPEEEIAPEFLPQLVDYAGPERPGTLIVDPNNYFLYWTMPDGMAMRYGIGVGREGFEWSGRATIRRKAEWPDWRPPASMRRRQPELPVMMVGGPENPLGARALYLYQGDRDTLYRIHGTHEPHTIGQSVSSGCIRMLNQDVIDLYTRVPIGSAVVVQKYRSAPTGPGIDAILPDLEARRPQGWIPG